MDDRLIALERAVLDKNERLAAELRARFHTNGTLTVNLISSPGTGKTALLEEVLRRLAAREHGTAALVGDCATDNDAKRLARSGAPVRQIVTEGLCHLEAHLVASHLDGFPLDGVEVLFIENVGNLVCPTDFDLGEDVRVLLLSTTEGEDKPLKYPQPFASADLIILTKVDLAEAVGFDRDTCLVNLASVNPGATVIETSARSGEGVDHLVTYLLDRRRALVADGQAPPP